MKTIFVGLAILILSVAGYNINHQSKQGVVPMTTQRTDNSEGQAVVSQPSSDPSSPSQSTPDVNTPTPSSAPSTDTPTPQATEQAPQVTITNVELLNPTGVQADMLCQATNSDGSVDEFPVYKTATSDGQSLTVSIAKCNTDLIGQPRGTQN